MEKPSQIPVPDREWQQTPESVKEAFVGLWHRGVQLEQVLEQQTARIASLEEELARRKGQGRRRAQKSSSETGSKPSSGTGKSSKSHSSGRSPGGQPGHEGHGRRWFPVARVDEFVPVKPSACHRCGRPLTGDDPHPQRHQQVEIPPVRVHVIEYHVHTLRCGHCDGLTEAAWPEGVSPRTYGPSVQSWVGLLAGAYRMSRRNIVSLLSEAFGLKLSLGTVSELTRDVSAALARPVEEARRYVQQQPWVDIDETSWPQGRVKGWLWTAVTAAVTVFVIRTSRGRDVLDELLGDSTPIVGSDRFSTYGHLPLARRQICWAHLRRTFEDFLARGGEAAEVGEDLLEWTDQMFTWWHRVRDGTLEPATFRVYLSRIRWRIRLRLWYGSQFADAKTAATCSNLLPLLPALWTFARVDGLEPTNNDAERALRHGVLLRHTSFGTQGPEGSRFIERLLTARDTMRLQQRNLLDFLRQACQAAVRHQAPPSLLPRADLITQ